METGNDRAEALEWVLSKLSAAKKAKPLVAPVVQAPKPTAAQKKADLSTKQGKEVELWHAWKKSGEDPKHLTPLLKSLTPLIRKRVNVFSRAEVPVAATEHEHKKKAVEALRSWDPSKGALNTWIDWKMKNAGRFVERYKNVARIPENISKHIGSYNAVKSELREKLGFEPDAHKIHEFVMTSKHPTLQNVSLKDLNRLEKEQRKTFIDQGFDQGNTGPGHILSSRHEEVAHLIIPQLTDHERAVHEFSLGLNGKPKLKPGQIAKTLKMDGPKVAKLRSSIWKKMQPFLGDDE